MTHPAHKPIFPAVKLLVLLIAGILFAGPPPLHANGLPELGQDSASIISPFEERKIGEDAMNQIRVSLDFVNDPELTQYLQALGTRLTARLPDRRHDFQFFLIAHPSVNAFALPGGFVGIHTGLVLQARSESELAAVLAHEISHVSQRHWPRMVAAQQERSGVTLAAVLAAIVIAGSGNPNGAGAAVAAMAANADSQLVFTRSFEREADRIGIGLLAESGYDVTAMASFFERLAETNRYGNMGVPEFMLTHPVTSDRIAEARGNENRFPRTRTQASPAFLHFQARTRVLYDPEHKQVLAMFQRQAVDNKASELVRQSARYATALAYMQLADFAAARTEIRKLLGQKPGYLPYQLAEADIELGSGNQSKGLGLYHYIYKSHTDNVWVIQRYAETLLARKKPDLAIGILKPALRRTPDNALLNKLLATAAGETGDLIQAHRSMAEYYILSGNPHAAINQLSIAEKNAVKNYYALAAIKARRQEMESSIAPTKPR